MIEGYLDLARTHAALLVVSVPFFGAALAVTIGHARTSWAIATLTAIATALIAVDLCVRTLRGGGALLVAHEGLAIEADGLSAFALAVIASATALTAISAQAFLGRAERAVAASSPALVLALGGAWSGAVLARDFTTLFVFVEIAWLAGVGLVALSAHKSRGALNGALRMATLGGVAAAFFLLGMALAERALGGATIATIASQRIVAPNMAAVGLALMLVALVCKAGLAPLNAWAAATYGRASGFATLALCAVGAPGAMFALAHLATAALAAPAIGAGIGLALSVLGVASAIIGSVQAIGAGNIWRLAAYSGAAQMGCVVLAIALGSPAGIEAALIQTVALSASLVALVGGASLSGADARMTSLDGLGRRAPFAGIVMTAGALSLMGAPLTLSFLGRWRLVEAALGIGWWWVAAAAIVLSLAGSYYGGRLIERVYFRHATQSLAEAGDGLRWKFALAPALVAAFLTIVSAVEPTAAATRRERRVADDHGSRPMSGVAILALLLALPVISAALVMICARPPGLRDVIHIGFALGVAVLGALLFSALRQHEAIRLTLAHPLPGVELAFAVEPLGALFTVIVAGLSVLHAVHTVGFVRATAVQAPARMMAFIALTAGATIAVALSANLFTLFVAYQALILAGAPLIQDREPEEEGRAARVYLTTQLGASIGLFLPAVVWTYSLAGAAEFQAGGVLAGLVDPISANALLVLFVLGASMSIVPPLSSWINASSGSRWPALTSIQSLALAPAGVITIVKIAAYVFGPALIEASLAAHALLVLCGGGAGLAALIAISRQDLNERIAYICAAQNLSALVGALLALPAGLFASTLQVAATCCAGSTVIMASGAVAAVTGRVKAADYVGLGRVMPWTLGGFAVGSASMIGMPPFAGAWAKLWLITAAAGAGLIWAAGLVGVAAVLTFAALGPLAANALAGKAPTDAFRRPDGASIFLAAPIVIGAMATFSLLALADSLATFLSPVWTPHA